MFTFWIEIEVVWFQVAELEKRREGLFAQKIFPFLPLLLVLSSFTNKKWLHLGPIFIYLYLRSQLGTREIGFVGFLWDTYVAPMSKKLPSVSMSLKLSTALWFPQNRITSPEMSKKIFNYYLVMKITKQVLLIIKIFHSTFHSLMKNWIQFSKSFIHIF